MQRGLHADDRRHQVALRDLDPPDGADQFVIVALGGSRMPSSFIQLVGQGSPSAAICQRHHRREQSKEDAGQGGVYAQSQ